MKKQISVDESLKPNNRKSPKFLSQLVRWSGFKLWVLMEFIIQCPENC